MNDKQRRETLQRELDGHWEYVCQVTSPIPFEDDTWGRGGIMTIGVSLTWIGVSATILGERLWATKSREIKEGIPANGAPLAPPIQWNADGGVVFHVDQLSFDYFSGDGLGVTKDSFGLVEFNGTLYVRQGTFKHQRPDGQRVEGTVRLRKMDDFGDFQWAPMGVKPLGTVPRRSNTTDMGQIPPSVRRHVSRDHRIEISLENAGNVIIGNVSGGELVGTVELPLASGDLNSLAKIFSKMGVPTEDVEQITKIVESEIPKQGAIGPKAAEWVGGMVAKSLTGAWELGKGISSAALAEIILRFYGVK